MWTTTTDHARRPESVPNGASVSSTPGGSVVAKSGAADGSGGGGSG